MCSKIILENGVRILFERMPGVRSCSVGIWVESGSRHEPEAKSGISHFIEHMVFKGAGGKSAAQIAALLDGIGGQANAFTTKEHTSFYLKALDIHLKTGLELLCDMFFDPHFAESDVKTERDVIYEEISMYNDAPEDLCLENLYSAVFSPGSLGRGVLGTKKTLSRLTGRTLRSYMKNNYSPENTIVAVCGSFSDIDIEYLKTRFSQLHADIRKPSRGESAYRADFIVKRKPVEQNHLCIGFPSIPSVSGDRYAMAVMNGILGGGASSRLFQKVREDNGLCYSIYSFPVYHFETGVFSIYAALSRKTEEEAIRLIRSELVRFVQHGITEEELSRTREQMKANVLMSLESTNAKMNYLARSEIVFGHIPATEEIIERYDAVTADSVARLAGQVLDFSKISFSAVGKIRPAEYYASLLKDGTVS